MPEEELDWSQSKVPISCQMRRTSHGPSATAQLLVHCRLCEYIFITERNEANTIQRLFWEAKA